MPFSTQRAVRVTHPTFLVPATRATKDAAIRAMADALDARVA